MGKRRKNNAGGHQKMFHLRRKSENDWKGTNRPMRGKGHAGMWILGQFYYLITFEPKVEDQIEDGEEEEEEFENVDVDNESMDNEGGGPGNWRR
jgi:hypothetical protein